MSSDICLNCKKYARIELHQYGNIILNAVNLKYLTVGYNSDNQYDIIDRSCNDNANKVKLFNDREEACEFLSIHYHELVDKTKKYCYEYIFSPWVFKRIGVSGYVYSISATSNCLEKIIVDKSFNIKCVDSNHDIHEAKFSTEQEALDVINSNEFKTKLDEFFNNWWKTCDFRINDEFTTDYTVDSLLEYCQKLKEAGKGHYKLIITQIPKGFIGGLSNYLNNANESDMYLEYACYDDDKKLVIFQQGDD